MRRIKPYEWLIIAVAAAAVILTLFFIKNHTPFIQYKIHIYVNGQYMKNIDYAVNYDSICNKDSKFQKVNGDKIRRDILNGNDVNYVNIKANLSSLKKSGLSDGNYHFLYTSEEEHPQDTMDVSISYWQKDGKWSGTMTINQQGGQKERYTEKINMDKNECSVVGLN